MDVKETTTQYTCNEYREEMILVGLQKRLQQAQSEDEKVYLRKEIEKLQKKMGL
ncbi:MAG: hypothetical protein V2I36_05170 [Desulfopila sp.]|jgi:hypothetical protein|nr:hypothetical protein [Desulfopila sp.]